MNNIAYEQGIELLLLLVFAVLYVMISKLIILIAKIISGESYGILRQIICGVIFVLCLAVALILANNYNIAFYNVFVYICLVVLLTKCYSFTGNIIYSVLQKRKRKYEK